MDSTSPPSSADGVPRPLRVAASWGWRILVVAAVVVGALALMGRTLVVVVPLIVGFLLTRALWPLYRRLRATGLPPAIASAASIGGLIIVVAGILVTVGVAFAGEVDQLGPTLREGIDDVETWLVEDSPWDISRTQVEDWKEQGADALRRFLRQGSGSVVSGALVVGEVILGSVLALIIAFFFLKDGPGFRDRAVDVASAGSPERLRRGFQRAWDAAGGYLKGAALLGVVEGIAIGVTLWLVGASLAIPVAVITLLAAYVPIVGAVAAGVIATLVALATAGTGPAVIVAVVAFATQQFDNDLLAPVIYGKSLELHPLVILLGIAAGGSLFGLVGTFLTVPVLAMAINGVRGYREAAPAQSAPA